MWSKADRRRSHLHRKISNCLGDFESGTIKQTGERRGHVAATWEDKVLSSFRLQAILRTPPEGRGHQDRTGRQWGLRHHGRRRARCSHLPHNRFCWHPSVMGKQHDDAKGYESNHQRDQEAIQFDFGRLSFALKAIWSGHGKSPCLENRHANHPALSSASAR
jgi:hypothetical protein